ncbi:MAG: hypothetical protein PF690_11215 [Deltaproteobacteria bacterium]|jgi:hypothetical protein|nr:hypothetical protein [Deltaproteobacteria bacterium]
MNLIAEASCLAMLEIDSESSKDFSLDDMAYFLANENSFCASAEIPDKNKIKQTKSDLRYWDLIKKEFISFLCTDDKKYDDLRQKLNTKMNQGKTTAIGIISAVMGEKLGLESTSIIGFSAILLYFAIKIHKEAFCTYLAKSLE